MNVYLLKHVDGNKFKIGKAENISVRLQTLGIGNFIVEDSRYLSFKDNKSAYRCEKMLHRALNNWHIPFDNNNRFIGDTEYFDIQCLPKAMEFINFSKDLMNVVNIGRVDDYLASQETINIGEIIISSLFGIVRKCNRSIIKDKVVFNNDTLKISYSGEQLDQADLDVWLGLLKMADENGVINTKLSKILRNINRDASGGSQRWLIESINRIFGVILKIKVSDIEFCSRLINSVVFDEKTNQFQIKISNTAADIFSKVIINDKVRDKLTK